MHGTGAWRTGTNTNEVEEFRSDRFSAKVCAFGAHSPMTIQCVLEAKKSITLWRSGGGRGRRDVLLLWRVGHTCEVDSTTVEPAVER